MEELLGTTSDNIGLHLKNIYKDGELQKNSTTEKISVVQKEGIRDVKRQVFIYNLDAIISEDFRKVRRKTNYGNVESMARVS